jgi:hypothetical protein
VSPLQVLFRCVFTFSSPTCTLLFSPKVKELRESCERLKLQMKQALKVVDVAKSGSAMHLRMPSTRANDTAAKKLRQRNTELEARNRNLSKLMEEVNDQHRAVIHKVRGRDLILYRI